jgi:hypothetical protein
MTCSASRTIHTSSLVVAGLAATLIFAAGAARAEDDPPGPGSSAVSQYVEMVPTAGGQSAPGVGAERRAPLSPKSAKSLKKATPEVRRPLEKIVTSSTYGAPTRPVKRSKPADQLPDRPPVPSATLRSGIGAIGSTSDVRLVGLLIVVLLTTVGAVVLAVGRTKRR